MEEKCGFPDIADDNQTCMEPAVDVMIVNIEGDESHLIPVCDMCYYRAIRLNNRSVLELWNKGLLKENKHV